MCIPHSSETGRRERAPHHPIEDSVSGSDSRYLDVATDDLLFVRVNLVDDRLWNQVAVVFAVEAETVVCEAVLNFLPVLQRALLSGLHRQHERITDPLEH